MRLKGATTNVNGLGAYNKRYAIVRKAIDEKCAGTADCFLPKNFRPEATKSFNTLTLHNCQVLGLPTPHKASPSQGASFGAIWTWVITLLVKKQAFPFWEKSKTTTPRNS